MKKKRVLLIKIYNVDSNMILILIHINFLLHMTSFITDHKGSSCLRVGTARWTRWRTWCTSWKCAHTWFVRYASARGTAVGHNAANAAVARSTRHLACCHVGTAPADHRHVTPSHKSYHATNLHFTLQNYKTMNLGKFLYQYIQRFFFFF